MVGEKLLGSLTPFLLQYEGSYTPSVTIQQRPAETLQQQLNSATSRAEAPERAKTVAERAVAREKERADTLAQQNADLQRRLDGATSQADREKERADVLARENADLQRQLTSARERADTAERSRATAEQTALRERERANTSSRELQESKRGKEAAIAGFRREAESRTKDAAEKELVIVSLQTRVAELEKSQDTLKAQLEAKIAAKDAAIALLGEEVRKLRPPPAPPTPVRKELRVVEAFDTTEPDEIPLAVGDVVYVAAVFADGWATGTHLTSYRGGMFPFACVEQTGGSSTVVPRTVPVDHSRGLDTGAWVRGPPPPSGTRGPLSPSAGFAVPSDYAGVPPASEARRSWVGRSGY